jgi:hypothetical protein
MFQVGLYQMFIGNAIYIILALAPIAPRYLLLVGRVIIGIGSGNSSYIFNLIFVI